MTSHVQFLVLLEAVISCLFYVTLLKLSACAWGTFAMDIVSEFSQHLKDKIAFGVDLHWTWVFLCHSQAQIIYFVCGGTVTVYHDTLVWCFFNTKSLSSFFFFSFFLFIWCFYVFCLPLAFTGFVVVVVLCLFDWLIGWVLFVFYLTKASKRSKNIAVMKHSRYYSDSFKR